MDERGNVPVGLDRSPEPVNGGLIGPEIGLRDACRIHPGRGFVVAGESRNASMMWPSVSSARPRLHLPCPIHALAVAIPIQRQRLLTFGNALGGAFGENMDDAHQAMRPRVIGRVGKYPAKDASTTCRGAARSISMEVARMVSTSAMPTMASTFAASSRSACSKNGRACDRLAGPFHH